MKADMAPLDVWSAELEDKPGSLASKLEALARAGVSLEFVIARRHSDQSGTGIVYVTPISGAGQTRAAKQASFNKATELAALRIDVADKPGMGAAITKALAAKGINLRGMSAEATGRKAVAFLAFDSKDDARKAMKILKSA
jgi:hypothetical protein